MNGLHRQVGIPSIGCPEDRLVPHVSSSSCRGDQDARADTGGDREIGDAGNYSARVGGSPVMLLNEYRSYRRDNYRPKREAILTRWHRELNRE